MLLVEAALMAIVYKFTISQKRLHVIIYKVLA